MDHKAHPIGLLDILSMRYSAILLRNYFCDINQRIFEKEHTDLQHLYIDGSKFEANATSILGMEESD